MNDRRFFLATLVVDLLLIVLLAPAPAAAHSASTFYPSWWQPDNLTVYFYFDDSFPSGAHRTRMLDGRAQWNYATGADSSLTAEPQFQSAGQRSSSLDPLNACAHTLNILYWWNLPPGALGYTDQCVSGTRLIRFSMSIDSTGPWYTGTGDAPSNQYDLWSTASHEWGHATGWFGHFAETSAECPETTSRHTMCPGGPIGSEARRTLATHDIHTYDARY